MESIPSIAVHGIDTGLALKKIGSIKSEVGTELKPETLAVQCKVRRGYKSQIRQLKKQRWKKLPPGLQYSSHALRQKLLTTTSIPLLPGSSTVIATGCTQNRERAWKILSSVQWHAMHGFMCGFGNEITAHEPGLGQFRPCHLVDCHSAGHRSVWQEGVSERPQATVSPENK